MSTTDQRSDAGQAGAQQGDGQPMGRLRRITGGAAMYPLFVLFGLNAVDQLDRVAFGVLAPNIRDSFGLSLAGILGLITLITPVTLAIGIPVAYFADRTRRVRLAVIGAALWALFSAATGLAVNLLQLGIARIGSGLAKTTNDPTHNSLLADYYGVDVRPSVYAVHQAAQNVGNFASPIIAGLLAFYFTWRVPFMVFVIPTVIFVLLALRLREPKRGVQDRLALGASEEDANTEETPPTFSEATRMIYSIKSLRRIFIALPFWGASLFGILSLLNLFYSDVYHLNSAQRGFITAGAEPFAILGLIVGTPIAQRLMRRDPALVLRFLAVSGLCAAGGIVVVAMSPVLVAAVAGHLLYAAMNATLLPGVYAIFSVAIPARTRALGFTYATIFLLPGVLALPVIGGIGDVYGLRIAFLVLAPLYLAGAFIISSAGAFVKSDIEAVRVGSMAEHEVRKALAEGDPKLLMARNVDVAYDQVQVLFGVNMEMKPGEIVALLGTNGAGKSTLLKAISGLVDPAGGAIYFDGVDITHVDPMGTFKLGIVQMPGGRSVFPTITVEDHIKLAGMMLKDDPEHVERATAEVLDLFPRLKERWDQPAGNLSGGEQQMLGLSMSLIAKPKLLMIDELSLGLAPTIVEQLLKVLRRIHAQGTAIILVEQSVNVALTVAERAYFLEKGEVRFSGPTAELLDRGDILRAVFLEGAAGTTPAGNSDSHSVPAAVRREIDREAPPALEVTNIARSFGGIKAVNDVSFTLAQGEILGLIGPNGAGKTTVFDLISGYLPLDSGSVVLGGTDVTTWSPDRRARAGLGRSFQDARIFPSLTVAENLAVSLERHLDIRDHVADAMHLPAVQEQEQNIRFTTEQLIELMNLGAFRDKFVSELSTGSRRIVDLAMAIAHDPKVLILDEPSSGIAQRETEALGPLLQRIQREVGCAMLVIEHDMLLITTISDRMLALELGRIIAQGTPSEVTSDPQVVSSYLGGDLATIHRSGAAVVGVPAGAAVPSQGGN
jgi:branched-chain amino acid transport system ATP-binding protein